MRATPPKKLSIVFIRPSKYDDEGYVIRYVRGVLPSNTLACLRSLTLDIAGRWKQERGLAIDIEMVDDIVESIPYGRLARKNRRGEKVIAALVGVQSNQFPRAADIAGRLAALGITTCIGGFHVSGMLAMFNEPSSELTALMDRGVIVVAGEAETIWERVLDDIVHDRADLIYRAGTLPDITTMPIPRTTPDYMKKFALPNLGTVDCSRGCPFNCSFCTIINVQGHRMRHRSAGSLIAAIRNNIADGIHTYFFTDDNFSRNPEWEAVFAGITRLREEEGLPITFLMQVDMVCDRIPGFIQKAARAGCSQVFIGMESINQKNLGAVGKNHNDVEHYAAFIDAWHKMGVMTHVGYIIGFPFDTPESVAHDIDRLKYEIKVDQASFFVLTPLPGSRDHHDLVTSGAYIDPDLNNLDSFHVTTHHPLMTADELMAAYQGAWDSFYDTENMKQVLLRAGKREYWNIFRNIMWYKNGLLEPRHPMVAGFIRRKNRTDVRPGTPVTAFWRFQLRRARELVVGFLRRVVLFFELQELWWLTRRPDDPNFRLAADVTTALTDAKRRLMAIDLTSSPTRWRQDAVQVITGLRQCIAARTGVTHLSPKYARRLARLMAEYSDTIDRLTADIQPRRALSSLAASLSQFGFRFEESILYNVARRRALNRFWAQSFERIRRGKFIRLGLSFPRMAVVLVRDFLMSIRFGLNMYHKTF